MRLSQEHGRGVAIDRPRVGRHADEHDGDSAGARFDRLIAHAAGARSSLLSPTF
jgi:hypothetical protein